MAELLWFSSGKYRDHKHKLIFKVDPHKKKPLRMRDTADYITIDQDELTPDALQLQQIVRILGPLDDSQTAFIEHE